MKTYKEFITEQMYEVPHISGKSKIKTKIPPENRKLKNRPRDKKGNVKVHFQKWLGIKGNGGKGYDGKYYGWSHRAIGGFGVGDKVTKDSIAYMGKTGESYVIKSEEEAKEHAKYFAKQVS